MAGQSNAGPYRGHEEERFLKAFEEYNDALFRHASLRISDREKAIDAVHDTFTKVWMYVKNGQTIDTYRPFLYKVLNNLIIDTYRKQRESSLDALLEQEGVSEGTFDDLSENTTEALAATIDGKQAFTLLETLPDVYREVLILRFVDELGPREISQLIEETENVVSVRIHRGLKLLREKMHTEIAVREQNLFSIQQDKENQKNKS
ncbi:MAG: RNA polymerase sigma factor [Candidatus Paceibacteria bacterium]